MCKVERSDYIIMFSIGYGLDLMLRIIGLNMMLTLWNHVRFHIERLV